MSPEERVVVGTIFGAVITASGNVSAQSITRPYDAPVVTNSRPTTPAKPASYLEQDEDGLRFVYHPSAHERIRAAIGFVKKTRTRIREQLGKDVLATLEIRVAALPEEMRSLGPSEDFSHYAPTITFSHHRLVITSLGSPRSLEQNELGPALAHALAHVALDEILEERPVPLWFHEGYAAYVAGDGRSLRAQTLVVAALQQRLFGIADMQARFPTDAPESSLAYAHAADLTRFLLEKPQQKNFQTLLERTRSGESFDAALPAAYSTTTANLESAWHASMARRYAFLPVFLGAMAVWAVCAAVIALRKLLLRKQNRPEKPVHASPEVERISTMEMVVARAERMPLQARGESTGATIPLETEVPKVEHEGDWHTLH
jgi:Peptidase MA superfamily